MMMFLFDFTVLATQIAAMAGTPPEPTWSELCRAIQIVETGSHARPSTARGDGGVSYGWLQLQSDYVADSKREDPRLNRYSYEEICENYTLATLAMHAYMRRYPQRPYSAEQVARLLNGGPNGPNKSSTLRYWHRVKKELKKERTQ